MDWSLRPLVDVLVKSERDNQEVSERARLLKMGDMTRVKQVEHAIAEDDSHTKLIWGMESKLDK